VPFRALIDYLEGGHTLAEFLEDFPTVTREQAVAARRRWARPSSAMRIPLDQGLPRRLKAGACQARSCE
jgi:hypothetical protein